MRRISLEHHAPKEKLPEFEIAKKHKLLCIASVLACFILLTGFLHTEFKAQDFAAKGTVQQDFTVLESNGGTYFGPVTDLVYTGTGEFQHLDGGIYQGSFQGSKRSGEGVFTWSNGDSYTGTWADDAMVNGEYRFADGRTYAGTFTNNKFSTGTFQLGETAAKYGLVSLSADCQNGQVTKTKWQASDGTAYDGDVSGWATIYYTDGSSYDGQVKNGSRDGTGTYRWKTDGNVTSWYEGAWSSGQMSGEGVYHYSSEEHPCLQGVFSNGRPTGSAVYYQAEGSQFQTSWVDGMCVNITAE